MKYTKKYKYWHKILDATEDKKKQLTKGGSKITDLMMDLSYARKPKGRVIFMNIRTGDESWIDVEYIGRAPINATMEEVKTLLKLRRK